MNIGIFTDTYYPQINGVAVSISTLTSELIKQGHTPYIFTSTNPNAPKHEQGVFRLPSMPLIFLPPYRLSLFFNPVLLYKLRKLKLDIIHTHTEFSMGVFGNLVAEVYGLPVVHTYHTLYEDYTHYIANGHLITPKMITRYNRFYCNRAKLVIAPTRKTKTRLLEYGVKRPIRIIPTGINLSSFLSEKAALAKTLKSELGISPNIPIVLYAGRLGKEKSIDVIINAMPELLRRIPNARLLIVGGGPAEEELRSLALRLNVQDNVIFAGFKPRDTMPGYYSLCDVFVSASVTETQGLTYAEAMAANRAVVAKKDKCVEELIIHNETGYLFEKDDELAELLHYVLINKDEAKRVADNAVKHVSELSSFEFGVKAVNAYEEAINAHAKRFDFLRIARLKAAIKNGVRSWYRF